MSPGVHALPQEKPLQQEVCALQPRAAPAHHNQRKPVCGNEDPPQPKNKIINFLKAVWCTAQRLCAGVMQVLGQACTGSQDFQEL